MQAHWKPQSKQETALARLEDEILYGGARGGGKTDAGQAWLLYDIDKNRYRALVIRRNADDLKDWIDRARLDDNMAPIEFLISIGEKATAATATQQGTSEKSQITLGEVKLLLNEAEDRINDLQEPYKDSWLEFGEKWSVLTESAADQLKAVKLYKKSFKGNYFGQDIAPTDWKSEAGYACVVKSGAEQERDRLNGIQKLLAIKAQFPQNLPLKEIVDKKMLDLAEISPEEQKQVLDFERQLMQQSAIMTPALPGASPGATGQPQPAINPAMNVRQAA